jgi:hypothetical protein
MDLLNNNNQDPIIDDNKDYLSELVGEDKKFKTAAELAKGKWHADQTIEVMKQRMDQLRADFERERKQNLTREQLESVMTRFTQAPLSSNEQPLVNEAEHKPTSIDPNQIKTLVSQEYTEMRKREAEAANAKMVQDKLIERFGTSYQDALSRQAVELGLSDQEVNAMAKTNPKVFIRTFGLDAPAKTEGFQAPARNSFNFAPTGGPDRTWNYYQKLRKDKPNEYYSPKIQNQMVEDYTRLGNKFEDGDFHQFN